MKMKLLFACTAILVIVIVSVPVTAAPPATTVNPVEQILTIVKDIQTNVGTILTRLTALQTDVTTIKTTTESLLQAPPEPTYYEYNTGIIQPFIFPGTEEDNLYVTPIILNTGDTNAETCWYAYERDPGVPYTLIGSGCQSQPPSAERRPGGYLVEHDQAFYFKIVTNSSDVVPYAHVHLGDNDGTIRTEYLPGDFQKNEIYS